jgi:hypothetical protein
MFSKNRVEETNMITLRKTSVFSDDTLHSADYEKIQKARRLLNDIMNDFYNGKRGDDWQNQPRQPPYNVVAAVEEMLCVVVLQNPSLTDDTIRTTFEYLTGNKVTA